MATEKPIGVAIVICDRIITELGSKNKTLVSTFNTITAFKFPCAHERMGVYVALTNGQGKKQVRLVLKTDGGSELFGVSGEIELQDPSQVAELIFNIRRIVFVSPGVYAFEVFADNEYIFESRFNVVQITDQQI